MAWRVMVAWSGTLFCEDSSLHLSSVVTVISSHAGLTKTYSPGLCTQSDQRERERLYFLTFDTSSSFSLRRDHLIQSLSCTKPNRAVTHSLSGLETKSVSNLDQTVQTKRGRSDYSSCRLGLRIKTVPGCTLAILLSLLNC